MVRLHLSPFVVALVIVSVPGGGKCESSQPAEANRIERLIRQLGSGSFRQREAASRALAGLGEPAREALRKATHSRDAEIRRRAGELIEQLIDRVRSRDMAVLEGRWVLKTAEFQGYQTNEDPTEEDEIARKLWASRREPVETRELVEDLAEQRTILELKGTTFEYRWWGYFGGRGHVVTIEGTTYLDVDRNPRILVKWWPDATHAATESSCCIYEVRGDTLRVCASFSEDPKDTPTEFATDRDDVVLLTFRREGK